MRLFLVSEAFFLIFTYLIGITKSLNLTNFILLSECMICIRRHNFGYFMGQIKIHVLYGVPHSTSYTTQYFYTRFKYKRHHGSTTGLIRTTFHLPPTTSTCDNIYGSLGKTQSTFKIMRDKLVPLDSPLLGKLLKKKEVQERNCSFYQQ